jgi:hypothetical protein
LVVRKLLLGLLLSSTLLTTLCFSSLFLAAPSPLAGHGEIPGNCSPRSSNDGHGWETFISKELQEKAQNKAGCSFL